MNIVLIFADQMHKFALGRVSDFVSTPNLDRLCDDGVLFSNAYSNNPVCGPYRGCLFTGQYTSNCGVILNNDPLREESETLADVFNASGYETSFVGKWHLGGAGNGPIPEKLRGGFRHFIGYQCYNGFYQDVCFYDENNTEHRFDCHRTDVTTDLAVSRLKMLQDTGKPFLHVVSYQAPHYPVQPAPEFEKLYAGKTIPTGEDYQQVDPYTPTYSPYSPRPFENCPDFQKYGGNMQEYLRLYYAMVSQVDAGVGKIISQLEELGIREETAVIFTADHGDMQGSHGLKNKCVPYEKSCGIPLIVSVPGGRTDVTSDALVSCVDFYPTCVELAGLKQPSGVRFDGASFAGHVMTGAPVSDKPVFAESFYDEKWKMIRQGRYKLTVDAQLKPKLLFDMESDPLEMHNLVDDGEYEKTVQDLLQNITRIVQRNQKVLSSAQ